MAREPAEPQPGRQRLAHDERRAQILECARRLFTDRPYGAVSMGEVAACAGVRRGLLHHYFGSKRDLYVEVVRVLLGRFDDVLGGGAPAGGERSALHDDPAAAPLEGLVAAYVDRWMCLLEEQADSWFALMSAEGDALDPEVRELVDRATAAMVDGIVTALHLDGASPVLRAVLRSYAGLADAATREWLRRGVLTRTQAHALLTSSLLATVRDVAPAVETAVGSVLTAGAPEPSPDRPLPRAHTGA